MSREISQRELRNNSGLACALLEDIHDLEVALERLRDPADPVLDWDQVRQELLNSE